MELETKSPFPGEKPHTVVALTCGVRKCRATSPCTQHDQVVLRLRVDGVEPKNAAFLSKAAFAGLTDLHRDPRELFHMLAELVLLANQELQPPPMADAERFLIQ